MKQLLVYTCCNKKYEPFIPLFCAALLYHNDNICIEIGIEGKMHEKVKNAVNILNEYYKNSILIDEDNVITNESGAVFNGKNIIVNTIRFLKQPKLKAEYVYISDIDIICMDRNICDMHIQHMKEIGKDYSNIVRKNIHKLTGLHFSKYDFYYPVNYDNINIADSDETVLYNIVSKKCDLDLENTYRPVHGIHMSPSRPTVKTEQIVGWGAEPYEKQWKEFSQTKLYKSIEPYFYGILLEQIDKLNHFYQYEQ